MERWNLKRLTFVYCTTLYMTKRPIAKIIYSELNNGFAEMERVV